MPKNMTQAPLPMADPDGSVLDIHPAAKEGKKEKKEKKPVSKFIAMQRIQKLLDGLTTSERDGVLAWLFSEYKPTVVQGFEK